MKTKIRNIIMVFAVISVLVVGSICAYFTDAETAVNVFTVGSVNIALAEPAFDTLKASDMYAGKIIEKDPTITNTGINDAYVYLKIKVPKANVITTNEDGVRNNKNTIQLFTYTTSEKWSLIESNLTNENYNEYVYAYETVLAQSVSTEPLFTEVQFANLVEGEILAGSQLDIIIDACAIQSSFSTTKTAEQAWQIYCNQNS